MKIRILRAAALVFLVLFLAGCTTTMARQTSSATSLTGITERGELVVGTAGNMPPFSMKTRAGDLMGLDIDLANGIAGAMGVKLKLVERPFSGLLDGLESGEFDMVISGMTITLERNRRFAFAGPYFNSGKAFLTKEKTIAEAEDFSRVNSPGTRLVALSGSTSQFLIEQVAPQATLLTVEDYDEAVRMVLDDEATAMVADYPACLVALVRNPDRGLISVITPLTYEPLGIALSSADAHLINWLDHFFLILRRTGQLKALHQKWFDNTGWLELLP